MRCRNIRDLWQTGRKVRFTTSLTCFLSPRRGHTSHGFGFAETSAPLQRYQHFTEVVERGCVAGSAAARGEFVKLPDWPGCCGWSATQPRSVHHLKTRWWREYVAPTEFLDLSVGNYKYAAPTALKTHRRRVERKTNCEKHFANGADEIPGLWQVGVVL
jgi:hypothetical protein